MADTLESRLTLRALVTRTVGMDLGTLTFPATCEQALTWPDGTSASQADEVWSDEATITSGAYLNLDLKALAETDDDGDATGRTVDFAKVKILCIVNTSSTGSLVVGGGTDNGGAADAWIDGGTEGWLAADSDLDRIPAGGSMFRVFPSGVTVTNTTSDILGLGAVGANQTIEILLAGNAS